MARLPNTGTSISMGTVADAFGVPKSNVDLSDELGSQIGYSEGGRTDLSDDFGGQDSDSVTPKPQ
jgi:hypothetical protein